MLRDICLVILLLSSLQAAPDDPLEDFNHTVRQHAKQLFHDFDMTNDGTFDHSDLQLFLTSYDTDKNGTIEKEEFVMHFDQQEPTLALVAQGLFIEFDADRSDHIDMTDLIAMYNRMDLNKDGLTSHQEFEEYFTEVLTILAILQIQGHEFS